MEARIEKNKETISFVVTVIGFAISVLSSEPSIKYLVAGAVSFGLAVVLFLIFRYSVWILLALCVAIIAVSSGLHYYLGDKDSLVVEKITIATNGDFIKSNQTNNTFLQQNKKSGAVLNLRIGLSNPAALSRYIKAINYELLSFKSFSEPPLELMNRIVVNFKSKPSEEVLIDIEREVNLSVRNQFDEMIVFDVPVGYARTALGKLRKLPSVVKAYPSLTGSGQSVIEFDKANNTIVINPDTSEYNVDIDSKIAGKDASGIETSLQFKTPGEYILIPKVIYESKCIFAEPVKILISD